MYSTSRVDSPGCYLSYWTASTASCAVCVTHEAGQERRKEKGRLRAQDIALRSAAPSRVYKASELNSRAPGPWIRRTSISRRCCSCSLLHANTDRSSRPIVAQCPIHHGLRVSDTAKIGVKQAGDATHSPAQRQGPRHRHPIRAMCCHCLTLPLLARTDRARPRPRYPSPRTEIPESQRQHHVGVL